VTYAVMPSTDVDPENDYASETVGVDSGKGLWVIAANGDEISFSKEVQLQIMDALEEVFRHEER
jgi:hypothetical protein